MLSENDNLKDELNTLRNSLASTSQVRTATSSTAENRILQDL